MATTARADLMVWRNDDVWEYPIEVRGIDLRVVSLAMQVRLAPDTPGEPAIDLGKVTAANAEGLRVAGVRTEAGVIISDLRVRLNQSTRQALPYAGRMGDSAVLAYALLIGGRTRLVGNLTLLPHAYGSNAAPRDRQPGYGAASGAALPSGGAVLSIAGQDVTVLSIDGLDMVQPLVARAETAAGAAEAAQGQAGAAASEAAAARDAAIPQGRIFPSVAAGVAGSSDGQYFTVPGTGSTALTLYRRENGAAVRQNAYPSLSGLAAFGTAAAVVPGVQQDQSAALNAQLADPTIKRLIAPPGVIWVSRTVRTPGATKLELQPDTVIRALPSFAIEQGRNHIVLLEGDGATITGGTVDAAKVGLGGTSQDRINGVTVLNGARDCVREDVRIGNCTGYAVYDSGNDDFAAPPSSINRRLRTFNAQIHLEAQAADGTVYEDCVQEDGDGDIPCLSWVHPLLGSRNISYSRCSATGATPAAWDVQANIAPLENITVDDCHYALTNDGGVGFATPAGNLAVRGLKVSRSTFTAPGGIGASLAQVEGSFMQTAFNGATGVETTDSVVECTGCTADGSRPTGGAAVAIGVKASGGLVSWSGGSISVRGPAESKTTEGNVRVSAETRRSPAPPLIRAVIRQEVVAQSEPQVDGSNTFANVFPPINVADVSKVAIEVTVRRLTPGYPAAPIPTPEWAMIDVNFFRIYFAGVALSPSTYRIAYRFTEIE